MDSYKGFKEGTWTTEINVSDFIKQNYTEYTGDESFLSGPTTATKQLWDTLSEMFRIEREKGIYDAETKIPSQIDAYGPGYINKDLEKIVGLQTDKPLKRGIFPNGGLRMVEQGLEAYGYQLDPIVHDIFTKYRKTHNEGVFAAYTSSIKKARSSAIITGLPDAYGRGRIIGDYRRVALYGVNSLIEERQLRYEKCDPAEMTDDLIRLREELTMQIEALKALKKMAAAYGYDISNPASTAREAIQWTYFAYLAAIKDQNGAAMSIGRVSTFLDIYIQRDMNNGTITEEQAQELMDHFVMKLRLVRFLRTPEYDSLFSGDPVWVTESIGGMNGNRSLVTKNSFRILHTLYNLGPSPEPNLTILWGEKLPAPWKAYCSKVSIDTSSLQYENDDLMSPQFGDDYGIACCVSPMRVGKQMQFFGARANLPKALLYAINGGKDEKTKQLITPEGFEKITSEYLDFNEVWTKFDKMLDWLSETYVKSLNIIHYMHDKYSYESLEMALHDVDVVRTQAFGIAGISIVADSFAAIKYGKVKVVRDADGDAVDYIVEKDSYVPYGNNDDSTDQFAVQIVELFMNKIRKHKMYRDAIPTQSVLTITSNVVYGKKTGSTPDGRKGGEPFGPGANPMHGRDTKGAIASLASVAKLPFEHANDGISYTFAITPDTLGKSEDEKKGNLVGLLDGYFNQTGQHLNVNVLNRSLLEDAMAHPENYPQLTIRVSGYAVNFIKLTREQQLDVLNRTITERL